MPHRCLACQALYADDASEVLRGCPCGGSSFLYLRQGATASTPGVTNPESGVYTIDVDQLLDGEKKVVDDEVVHARESASGDAYDIDLAQAFGTRPSK
jgi:predicted  nucleic acid-binding Zn-ribbon protein